VALDALAFVAFAALDDRLPQDLNHCHEGLPFLYHAVGTPAHTTPPAIVAAAVEPTGWYNLLIAITMHVLGRGPHVLEIFNLAWFLLLLLGIARLASRLGGLSAAATSLALVSSMPGMVCMTRTQWVHIPETAILLLAVGELVSDPELRRWRTVAVVAVGGLLVLTLRVSGMIWVVTLLPLLALLAWRGRRQGAWLRPALIVGVWSLSLFCLAPEAPEYLTGKMHSRTVYNSDPLIFLGFVFSFAGDGAVWLGLAGTALFLRRDRRRHRGIKRLLLAWMAIAVVLCAVFRNQIDDFPLALVALALAAGAGLTARRPVFAALPVALFLFLNAVSWFPSLDEEGFGSDVSEAAGWPTDSHYRNLLRVYRGFSASHIADLLGAACPDERGACTVVVQPSLAPPVNAPTVGVFELFLLGVDEVKLNRLSDYTDGFATDAPDALVVFTCDSQGDPYLDGGDARTPEALVKMAVAHDLRTVWRWQGNALWPCQYVWQIPGGRCDLQALPASPD